MYTNTRITKEELAKIVKKGDFSSLFIMRVNNDQTWILGNSFQKFLNAQDVYQIKPKPDCTNVSNEIAVEVKEYISRTDAAALAGVKPSTITKWVQLEKFSCVGAGSVLRIHRKTFLKWLKEYQKV